MEGFKEFLGKTLDAAIEEACSYYNASREKLEIEIVQDAKTGIFGIVGARKAKVRARRAALREVVESALGRGSRPSAAEAEASDGAKRDDAPPAPAAESAPAAQEARPEKSARRSRGRTEERKDGDAKEGRRTEERAQKSSRKAITAREESLLPARKGQTMPAVVEDRPQAEAAAEAGAGDEGGRTRNGSPEGAPRHERSRNGERVSCREAQRESRRASADDDMDEADDSLPRRALEELDQPRLKELSRDCVSRLIRPMLSQPVDEPEVEIVDGRVRVAVDCGEDSGLLIGREGQTLAALQYLASRIVSRGMDAAVRVQLDAGRYRQRQEEKLRDMALALAAKVRQTGRSYSTRPLSSYHRRIIHLCLQEMEDIFTRSTGDGPLKRVVILRRRPEKAERQPQEERNNRRRPKANSDLEGRPSFPEAAGPETPTDAGCPVAVVENTVREAVRDTAGQSMESPATDSVDDARARDEA